MAGRGALSLAARSGRGGTTGRAAGWPASGRAWRRLRTRGRGAGSRRRGGFLGALRDAGARPAVRHGLVAPEPGRRPSPGAGGNGWRGPERTWPGRGAGGPAAGSGLAAGGTGRPGAITAAGGVWGGGALRRRGGGRPGGRSARGTLGRGAGCPDRRMDGPAVPAAAGWARPARWPAAGSSAAGVPPAARLDGGRRPASARAGRPDAAAQRWPPALRRGSRDRRFRHGRPAAAPLRVPGPGTSTRRAAAA